MTPRARNKTPDEFMPPVSDGSPCEDQIDTYPEDHLATVWAKLTPDERLARSLRLHEVRRALGVARK